MPKRRKSRFARHREEGSIPVPDRVYEVKTTAAGVKTQTFIASVQGNGEWRSMDDVVTPDWNSRKGRKEHAFVMSPMQSLYKHQYGSGAGYLIRQKTNSDLFEGGGNWVKYLTQATLGVDYLKVCHPAYEHSWGNPQCQMAITEAATKAQRIPSDANVLVTLAELKKTRDMLPNLLSSWTQFFNRLSNKRLWAADLRRQGKNVAGSTSTMVDLADQVNTTYLMARFGLRPLIMESEGVLKAVQRQLGVFSRERHTSRGAVSYTEKSSGNTVGALGILRCPYSWVHAHNVEIRAMQTWEAEVDAVRDVGLALEQIPEAAIDLVKYSFIVNWVVNLNDYCSALANMYHPTWRSLGSCLVAKREIVTTAYISGTSYVTSPTIYELLSQPSGIATATMVTKGRSVGLPTIGLTVRARPLRWMEDARLIDAVGLLRNALRPHQQNLNQLAQLRAAQLRSRF